MCVNNQLQGMTNVRGVQDLGLLSCSSWPAGIGSEAAASVQRSHAALQSAAAVAFTRTELTSTVQAMSYAHTSLHQCRRQCIQ